MQRVHLGGDGTRARAQLCPTASSASSRSALRLPASPTSCCWTSRRRACRRARPARMIDLIASLPRTFSILMIEHDMKVVFSVADRITVLYYGEVLATGTPADIQANDARARGLSRGGALMLDLENVNAYYGDSHILHGVSLAVKKARWSACSAATAPARPRPSSPSWAISSRAPAASSTAVATSRRCRPMRWPWRGQAGGDPGRRSRRRQPVPRPRDAAHRRRRRQVDDWEWRGAAPELEKWATRLGADHLSVRPRAPGRSGASSTDGAHRARSGGVHVLRARRRSRRRRSRAAAARVPRDLVRVARADPGARARPATAPWRPTSAATRRAPGRRTSTTTGSKPSSATWSGSPTRSARRPFHLVGHDWGGAVAWYARGAARRIACASLTVGVDAAPTPFGTSIREGEQKEKSAYMDMVPRAEGAEEMFLADDGAMMRRALAASACTTPTRSTSTTGCSRRAGAALTGGLNWYRANTSAPDLELPAVTVPTMYVWSTDDSGAGSGGRRGDGRVGHRAIPIRGARGREPLAARKRLPTCSTHSCSTTSPASDPGHPARISAGQGQSP